MLLGAQTAHSCLKLPLNLATNPEPTCDIRKKSSLSDVMCAAKLIVCDEISIVRKGRAEPFVTSANVKPFGGLTVLICG